MKKLWVGLSFFIGTLGLLAVAPQAQAVPAFARQMGVACNTCHFQHFPELNAFGRAFKASGFTMTGTSLIESDHFSLPSNLNAAIFTNLRWQHVSGGKGATANGTTSQFVMPGETSLFVGGRVTPHIGALLEGDVGGCCSGAESFLASLKVPILLPVTSSINAGIVPFSAGLGPAYGFEVLNTGAVGNHLINLVVPDAISAQQYVQDGGGQTNYGQEATGFSAVAVSSQFFVNVSKWAADRQSLTTTPTADYVRVAITPTVAGWDTGLGVQWYGGRTQYDVGGGMQTVKTRAWAVDAQMQGQIANMPLGVYVAYAQAPSSSNTGAPNLYNLGSKTKKSASVAAELGAFDDGRVTLQAAYRWGQTGAASANGDNAATVGVTYLPWNNFQVAVLETLYSGSAHDKANGYPAGTDADWAAGGSSLTSVNVALGF